MQKGAGFPSWMWSGVDVGDFCWVERGGGGGVNMILWHSLKRRRTTSQLLDCCAITKTGVIYDTKLLLVIGVAGQRIMPCLADWHCHCDLFFMSLESWCATREPINAPRSN